MLIKDSTGNEYTPEDYFAAFARFVKENREHIEAINILVAQPERWGPHVLRELLERLESTPQHFTKENLQKAHTFIYNKDLVDIISMIKHAADERAPFYTAEERVTNAFTKVTTDKRFTDQQKIWLDRIREHLIANLAIDIEVFQVVPVFADLGGWGTANHVFGHRLNEILRDLNKAVAG